MGLTDSALRQAKATGRPYILGASDDYPWLFLPEFLRVLRGYDGRAVTTQLGIRLLLLTGVRTGELRRAEPGQLQLGQGLRLIPPPNVKQWQVGLRRGSRRARDIPAYIVSLAIPGIKIVRYLLERVKPAQR